MNHLRPFLTSTRGQTWLLSIGIGESAMLLMLLAARALSAGQYTMLQNTGMLFTAAAVVFSVASLPLAAWLAGSRVMHWLSAGRARGFLVRLAAVLFGGLLVFAVYKTAIDGVAHALGSANPYAGMQTSVDGADVGTLVVGTGLLLAWPPVVYLFVLAQAALILLTLTLFERVAVRALKVIRR